MAVLRSDYNGPSYITGFNKCCRGSYQRWALKELLRSFEVPQEVNLYQERAASAAWSWEIRDLPMKSN
jgi:hypothetical protein